MPHELFTLHKKEIEGLEKVSQRTLMNSFLQLVHTKHPISEALAIVITYEQIRLKRIIHSKALHPSG